MHDPIEIIEIPGDPFNRIAVYVDEDASNPRTEWHQLTGFVHIQLRASRDYIDVASDYGDTMRLVEAYERFDEARYRWSTDEERASLPGSPYIVRSAVWTESAEDYVVRYARAIHGAHIEWDSKYGGFWFVPLDPNDEDGFKANWPELVDGSPESLARQAEVIKQEREAYRQWADGEVVGVALQRHERHPEIVPGVEPLFEVDPAEDLDLNESGWDEIESIWGVYLDDDTYTALDAARENWSIPSLDRKVDA